MKPATDRIAVTGVGIVSALGPDATTSFRRLIAGEVGFSPISLFDVEGQRSKIAAEVPGLRVADVVPESERPAWSRSDAMAVIAAREALAQAELGRAARLALAIGATTGGMFEAEDVLASMRDDAPVESMRRLLSYPLSTSADHVAQAVGSVVRRVTICSACSSGAMALVQGASWLLSGQADAVLAGGTDGLCRLTLTGFNALGATSLEACRPFDARRDGLTLGEGAGFLLLETESAARARGARVLGFLSGWSVGAEAHHITHPEPSGATAARLIEGALRRAGLAPGDIDYVNAHGTGTLANDAMETRALSSALGPEIERVAVSSTKGQLGHTLGAAGAIEAAITVLALDQGVLPPTGGLEQPDPELRLQHVMGKGQKRALRAALSSSFGFGGTGSVLAFEHAARENRRQHPRSSPRLVVTAAVTIGRRGVVEGAANRMHVEAGGGAPAPIDPLAALDPARSRRFDRASALVTLGAERALAATGLAATGVGLVAGTAFGNVERSVAFLERVFQRGPRFASPADFPHLVPSAPSGNASIYAGLSGPVVAVSDVSTSAEAALEVAAAFVSLGLASAVIAGSAEPEDRIVARVLGPLHARRPPSSDEGSGWLLIEARGSAQQRGAPLLAEILRIACSVSELAPPVVAERARVVLANAGAADALLAGSPWANVARLPLSADVGTHEARGAFALAAAAALIATGAADEVVACGCEAERTHLVQLVRPAPDEP
jgi:3-oxoacyl-[acyl-carrier-protein] synthase II